MFTVRESLGTEFTFLWPWAFWCLLILPLLWSLPYLRRRARHQKAIQYSSLHLLQKSGVSSGSWKTHLRSFLLSLATIGFVFALARPQWQEKVADVSEDGIEMIVAIDVSPSMTAQDFEIGGRKVNRLEAAKKVTRDFIQGRMSDRIGLVAFAGRPYLASPLTTSKDWLIGDNGVGRIRTGLAGGGTAIGSAIASAAKRLDGREARSKVIILVTDGANTAGELNPVEAARLAKTLGIKIYTIAVGTPGTHEIWINGRIRQMGPSESYDEAMLREIATIADGDFFEAGSTDTLEDIFAQIDKLEKSEITRETRIEVEEWYTPFLLAGVAFSILVFLGDDWLFRVFPSA